MEGFAGEAPGRDIDNRRRLFVYNARICGLQSALFYSILGDVMKIEKEFVLREIAGEYILVPVGSTALELNGLITVNEVGVFIWKLLQNDVTLDEIVQAVLDEYDVEESVARKDAADFLAVLQENNIL